jgi:small-conductance mechanosensitive channel
MFGILRTQVSWKRRALAWGILTLLAFGGILLLANTGVEKVENWGVTVAWVVGPFIVVWLLAYLLIDPLLRQRQTSAPGFARDIIVFALYIIALGVALRETNAVSLNAIWGTGAIAAAILGLSLQQALGNLFAGLSMYISPAFQVGDWIELSGNVVNNNNKSTYIGQVQAVTWRCVYLRNENGDTDVVPNLLVSQAVVTNLYEPSGLHRRTGRIVIAPSPDIHLAISKLKIALAGIPHMPTHTPEVVAVDSDLGGLTLEMRWWSSGFHSGKEAQFQAFRLAATCLPREGFPLLGYAGPTTVCSAPRPLDAQKILNLLEKMELPTSFADELQGYISIRYAAPGEGIIRTGDPGESLFWILKGSLSVVEAELRHEPRSGIFWRTIEEMKVGDWCGETSLLTGAPRKSTIIADTECELAEIPKEAFESVLRDDPHFIEYLVSLMMRRHPMPETKAQHVSHREHWYNMIMAWFRAD